MYRMNRQMRIEDFVFPYGQLDKNNGWVKLADFVPWDEAEEAYAKPSGVEADKQAGLHAYNPNCRTAGKGVGFERSGCRTWTVWLSFRGGVRN